ncbi:MAG: hypothetical protein ABI693_00220 [Bryobacteraceae bacterium]
MKIAPSRQEILYTAEFGSSQSDDFGAFAVDPSGAAYLAGFSGASDFPVTPGAYQRHAAAGGPFILQLDNSGARLVYSTFLDQSPHTRINSLALNAAGNVYLAGETDGLTYPTTSQAYQRSAPADWSNYYTVGFVTELQLDGSGLVFSTLFGGTSGRDTISSVTVAFDGTVNIAGDADSRDFPITEGFSWQGHNAFRARLDATGSHLLQSSLLAGTTPLGMVSDSEGNQWMVENVNGAIFVLKWDVTGAQVLAQVISPRGRANSMTILPNGHLVIGGTTEFLDFPTRDAILPCMANLPHDPLGTFDSQDGTGSQAFVMEIDAAGTTVFSTLLGGRAFGGGNSVIAVTVDPRGGTLITGTASDPSFPGGATLGAIDIAGFTFALRLDTAQATRGNPAPSCLVDGVSFRSAPLARGSFATLFGSNLGPAEGISSNLTSDGRVPLELSGVRVSVGGIDAPILYASDGQMNFLVPQSAGDSGQVCVSRGEATNCIFTYLAASSPGIFKIFSLGVYAILNQNATLNTPQNPASRGSYISLFGAGFGPLDRSVADGSITDSRLSYLTQPIQAIFDDPRRACNGIHGGCLFPERYQGTVSFAGAAPLAVNGLTQINVKVPDIPVPGTTLLSLILGDTGGAAVTISVK